MEARLKLGCVALVGGLALLEAPAPASAEGRPGYGGDLLGSLLSEPAALDPVAARSYAEVTVASLVYDSLYRFDESGQVVPHLAAAMPTLGPDRREARILLRPEVRFHDGSPVTVADVVASLLRVKQAAGWLLAPVRAIRAGGDLEVVIELGRDTPELTRLLAAPIAAVTPGGKPPRTTRLVGSGPFRLESISRSRHRLVLRAAELHFAGRPYLDRVELRWYDSGDEEPRLYERGKVQLSLRGDVAFSGHQPKYATGEVEGPATVLSYVGFGTRQAAVTDNRDLRAALSLAIGRNGFRGVGSGERVVPTLDPAPLDLGGAALTRQQGQARPEAARAALRRAAGQVPVLADVVARRGKLSLAILIDRSRPDDREIAEKVVAALYRLGLSARIDAVAATEFATRVARGKCDLYIGQLATLVPTPVLATAAAFAAGGDPWLEKKLAQAPGDLAAARREFERRLPILPLFHRSVRVHHRRDVHGVAFDPITRLSFADLFLYGAPLAASH